VVEEREREEEKVRLKEEEGGGLGVADLGLLAEVVLLDCERQAWYEGVVLEVFSNPTNEKKKRRGEERGRWSEGERDVDLPSQPPEDPRTVVDSVASSFRAAT